MRVKVELNHDGMRELLRSQEVADLLLEYAEKIQSNCAQGTVEPDEYSTSLKIGGTRAKASVFPITRHAYYSNLKHNTIEKAIEAVREQ